MKFALLLAALVSSVVLGVPRVRTVASGLIVDGRKAPFLFGAEVQYFRARAGADRNVPAAEVRALWEKLLDRVQEAKMNSVIFYIPWDFHEPVEGTFDFDGTLDQDRDGRPDYPSRNLKLFLRLVEARGLRNVMVRPGPYINAEWGPVGFGAIPKWFLEKYPQALNQTATPGKPKTAAFAHPEYRKRVVRWFAALHSQVLRPYLGPEKLVSFLQIDNETNYFWDSVYERDRGPLGEARFRKYLKAKYASQARLRSTYGKNARFSSMSPPKDPSDGRFARQWHYDWFEFHDREVHDYFHFLRTAWEKLGVTEKDVLFTSCDSFNAPANGLLPRLDYRQKTTVSTLNIYPKTFGTSAESILNFPMKAAHDARLFLSAGRQFGGHRPEWLMSTETMAGWFPPVGVTLSARQHTYGSLVGNGVKALMLYYFHEGFNWSGTEKGDSELFFDTPLDRHMEPRPSFALVKSLGAALEAGLGTKLLRTMNLPSEVLLAHDGAAQYPLDPAADTLERVSTGEAALFGLFREAGVTPEVAYLDALTPQELKRFRVLVLNAPGYLGTKARANLKAFLRGGGQVFSFGKSPVVAATGLIEWDEKFADPWNLGAVYPKMADGKSKLDQVRLALDKAGVARDVELSTDGEPGLHVWYRRGRGETLLFVENFSDKARRFSVRTPGTFERLWGGAPARVTAVNGQADLQVGADSVDIWSVK